MFSIKACPMVEVVVPSISVLSADTPFSFLFDAGHGWLVVRIDHLPQVWLTLHDFSPYSYMDGAHVYLEEDQDCGVFLAAFFSTFGCRPNIKEFDEGALSLVRRLPRLSAEG